MSKRNGTMESAIQDRMEANPDVLELNERQMKAWEEYLVAKEFMEKLQAKGQLSLDEQKTLKTLIAHTSEFERTVEASRQALREANERIMKSA